MFPTCLKCDIEFRGLGLANSPWQNKYTGQYICNRCHNRLATIDKVKYILI